MLCQTVVILVEPCGLCKHPLLFVSVHKPGMFMKEALLHTHTHTHPFNGPLSGTTRVSRYQKGKTNLDFTEATDTEWQ